MREPSEMKPGDDDPIKAIVLTGDDVEQLTEETWDIILSEYTEIVFSRTTPQQKMRIVEETKKRGDNIVAVVSSSPFPLFCNLLTWFCRRLEMESMMHRQ